MVVAILPMVIVSASIISYFSENHRQIVLQNYQSALAGMADKIDATYLDAVNILHEIDARYLAGSELPATLRYYLNRNRKLENIIYVAPDGTWELESRENKYKNLFFSFADAEWFSSVRDSGDGIAVTALHDQPYFNGVNDLVVSIAKNYYNDSGAYAGIIILDLNIHYFLELYRGSAMQNVEKLAVVDQSGSCVFSTAVMEIGDVFTPLPMQRLDAGTADAAIRDLDEDFYIVAKSGNMGYMLLLQLNHQHIFADLYGMQKYLLLLSGFAVMVVLALSVYFAFSMSTPLKAVLLKLQKIQRGNFEVEKTTYRSDEIGIISSGIDDMVAELKTYIDKEYFYQLRQKQAELEAFKMQIKPHYIYNTLEIIRVTAKEERAEKTETMIRFLADQMWYLFHTESEFVTLQDELDNVTRYVKLVQIRYENQLEIDVDYRVDEQALSYLVPKIILQPIVENIFKHAVSDFMTSLFIVIHVACTADGIEVVVFDNGRGMEAAAAAAILSQEGAGAGHIGLKNVDERIRLLYGAGYGLQIQSEIGMGMLVKILLPKSE